MNFSLDDRFRYSEAKEVLSNSKMHSIVVEKTRSPLSEHGHERTVNYLL